MAVLLLRANGSIGEALAQRLVDEQDEVRVIERFEDGADAWKELGAHVAVGPDDDADFIERAGQGVRTIVILNDEAGPAVEVLAPAIAAVRALPDARVVVCGWEVAKEVAEPVAAADVDHVIIDLGRRKLLGKGLSPDFVAEAIDAADDLAGNPRAVVQLNDPEGRRFLGLGEQP